MKYCNCAYDIHDDCKQYSCYKYLSRELAVGAEALRKEQESASLRYQCRIAEAIYNVKKEEMK